MQAGNAGVVISAVGWLSWINILLGGFNLLPAAPLDGGRVLRAILWSRSGDRVRSATTAARTGQVFAYLLIGVGVLEFLALGLIGLWFIFLGWFLLTAAREEESAAVMRSSLANVHVCDIMTPSPMTFPSQMTVADLLDNHLHRYRFSTYPLVNSAGQLEGLTTMGRIRHVRPDVRGSTRLIDTACPLSEAIVAVPSEPVPDLLRRMQGSTDGRALVIDDTGHFVGILSPSDISRFIQLSMLRAQGRASPGH